MANAISDVRTAHFPAPSEDLFAAGRDNEHWIYENAMLAKRAHKTKKRFVSQASLESKSLFVFKVLRTCMAFSL